jgi:hypothetical protein
MKKFLIIIVLFSSVASLIGCNETKTKEGQKTIEGDYVSEPGGVSGTDTTKSESK